jgi:hypothetical protein
MSLRSRVVRPLHIGFLAVVIVAPSLLTACGDEQASTSAVAADGAAGSAPASTTQPGTGSSGEGTGSSGEGTGSSGEGTGSSSGRQPDSGSVSTTTVSSSDVGVIEERVRSVVSGAPWGTGVTAVAVSPGEETIVSISTADEAFAALEACEAVRSELSADVPALAVNVWWSPDLTADGGDERQLATALPGGECELVRPAE